MARYTWFSVKIKKVDRIVADAILRRQNDEWSLKVKGQFDFVNDLHAEDVVYYRDFNSCFRSCFQDPLKCIAELFARKKTWSRQ